MPIPTALFPLLESRAVLCYPASMHNLIDTTPKANPLARLVRPGDVRRFGPDGTLYEVVRLLDANDALIRVIDTGEELPYAVTNIVSDPTD